MQTSIFCYINQRSNIKSWINCSDIYSIYYINENAWTFRISHNILCYFCNVTFCLQPHFSKWLPLCVPGTCLNLKTLFFLYLLLFVGISLVFASHIQNFINFSFAKLKSRELRV